MALPLTVAEALSGIDAGATVESQESEVLEFKREAAEKGEAVRIVLDAAICLANLRGGHIVLGAADGAAGADAFIGTTLDPDDLRQRVYALSAPPINLAVTEHLHHETRLLVLGVPEGMEMHSDTKGRSARRFGTQCNPLTIAQAAALQDDRRRYDWSGDASARGLDEVEEEAVEAARTMLRRFEDDRRALADAPVESLLNGLGLLVDGRMTRGCEVMFCSRDDRAPPVRYLFATSPGGEPSQDYRRRVPLLVAYREVIGQIQANGSATQVTLPDGQQLTLSDFPLVAVREALSNGLIHGDYRLDEPVDVMHSPTLLSVTSPGPLVSGVSRENILHTPSKPRNRTLTSAARILGLAEERSRGVDRMYREMIKVGKGPPEISEHAPFNVRVELAGGAPNQTVARFVASLPPSAQDDVDVMLVVHALLHARTLTSGGASRLLQRAEAATEAVLARMAAPELGLLAPADRRSRSWQLSQAALEALRPALEYRIIDLDDLDRKIIEFVRRKGEVDNPTIQVFSDLDVYTVSNRLKALRTRGILLKLGDQRAGPGIKYGPGPDFPT